MTPSVDAVLAQLKKKSTAKDRENLARFGIAADPADINALGVSMASLQTIAKGIGVDHALAAALWDTGVYEARMLCALIDDPALVTAAQMDRWRRDFDNWGIVDTVCFKLFDRTPHAWAKIAQWSKCKPEFEKRAAFALLASLALHDKNAPDRKFLDSLPLIEAASGDPRNFVKKGVSWALRSMARRGAEVRAEALDLARRLAASDDPAARWIGKDAVRDFAKSKRA